jgi:superfamily II DNA helicase RecQ
VHGGVWHGYRHSPTLKLWFIGGASANPLAYWQEVGRAGRAGQQAYAMLYPYPRSLMKSITSAGMLEVVQTTSCVRVHILEQLKTKAMKEPMPISSPCKDKNCELCACDMCFCCSFCHSRCECSGKLDYIEYAVL